jgi:hypothetical protein
MLFRLRALLMVLVGLRLLMPPGICACQWSSPAARLLIALTQSDRQIPTAPQRDADDDHDPGCPASPLAVGMGIVPSCEPLLPPALAFDLALLPQTAPLFGPVSMGPIVPPPFYVLSSPLYLTLRALLR